MGEPPRIFDRSLHRRRLTRAASGFARADFLRRRAAEDIVLRLEAVRREFPLAADLGARDGAFARALAGSDAKDRIGALIETEPGIGYRVADGESIRAGSGHPVK